MNTILTALSPEWTMLVLLIASFANLRMYAKVGVSVHSTRALIALTLHVTINVLILWAAFGVGFLA